MCWLELVVIIDLIEGGEYNFSTRLNETFVFYLTFIYIFFFFFFKWHLRPDNHLHCSVQRKHLF